MIRAATAADVPACVAMGLRFGADVYRDLIEVNPDALRTLGIWLLEHGAVFVAEKDGEAIGMIGVTVMPHPMTGRLFGAEVFWWVEPAHRGHGLRLLRHAEQWAHEHGAEMMQVVAPTGDVAQLYEHLGYRKIETAYMRELCNNGTAFHEGPSLCR